MDIQDMGNGGISILEERIAELESRLAKAHKRIQYLRRNRRSWVNERNLNEQEIRKLHERLAEANEALTIAYMIGYEQGKEKAEKRFTAPIVCMCGSTKFKQAWIAENARLTGEGNIVLAVGLWGHHERVSPDDATKAMLDDLHKRKIDLCDWVWVLDVEGYIGSSTRSEIEYATKLGRPIRYLSKEYPDYTEPIDPLVKAEKERDAANECHDVMHYEFEHAQEQLAESEKLRSIAEQRLSVVMAAYDGLQSCLTEAKNDATNYYAKCTELMDENEALKKGRDEYKEALNKAVIDGYVYCPCKNDKPVRRKNQNGHWERCRACGNIATHYCVENFLNVAKHYLRDRAKEQTK